MLYIILIVIIVVLVNRNGNLKEELDNLKKKDLDKSEFLSCPRCGYSRDKTISEAETPRPQVEDNQNLNINNQQVIIEPEPIKKEIIKKTSNLTKEEQKNNMILITGAILIVLSAIIFLLSTWMSTGNITKTIIIFLMLAVFFIISRISETKFKLKQTSEVFLYISLCYLPIAFLSISLFSLFGHYLSIFGSGKYIYLAVSSILISISYIIVKEKHGTLFLKTLTELFLILSVTFSSLAITSNIFIISIILAIYLITRQALTIKSNDITNWDKITYFTLTILSLILGLALINNIAISQIVPIEFPIYLALLLLNSYLLINKILAKTMIYDYVYPVLVIFIFLAIANVNIFEFSLTIKHIIVLLSTLILYGYDITSYKGIKVPTLIPSTIATYILCISVPKESFLTETIILLIYVIFSVINYIINSSNRRITSYFLTVSSLLLTLSIINDLNLPTPLTVLVSEILLVLSRFYNKLDSNLKKSFYTVGVIALCPSIIYSNYVEPGYISAITTFLGSIILFMHYSEDKRLYNKYLSYILFTASTFILLDNIGTNYSLTYAVSAASIIISLLEAKVDIFKEERSYYAILSSIVAFILLNIDLSITNFIILLVLNISLIYNNVASGKDDNLYILCALSLIHSIFTSNILIINDFNIMIIVAILIIALSTLLSYAKKNINQFTIITYVYIICSIALLDLSPYITNGLLIVSSFVHIMSNETKFKDLFKLIVYTSVLFLIKNILSDINLLNVTALNVGSTLVYAIILIRDIIKRYTSKYKFFEYFALSIINLIAIANYYSEFDGILYVTLLVLLIVEGYNNKYGPTFLTSLIFVVINALVLTREFWFSIPWWIYVLATGLILVLFAVRNEATNNETKEKVKKLKEDLDL